ncbi:MAG: thiamine phosphate synthase [Magnetococcales bacterium]|nr:thiamine phosphate synthase [Magnetococcales bacterium]
MLITSAEPSGDPEEPLERALEGGSFDLLLREPLTPDADLVRLARRLRPLLAARGGRLLIHGRPEVALEVGADGLHLPETAPATEEIRRIIGSGMLLGRSCHAVASACRHLLTGGDYVTLSPLFFTRSHPEATPLGSERFARMRAAIPGPVLALGGIGPENVAEAMGTGASGVALIRGVRNAPDPAAAVRTLLTQIRENRISSS